MSKRLLILIVILVVGVALIAGILILVLRQFVGQQAAPAKVPVENVNAGLTGGLNAPAPLPTSPAPISQPAAEPAIAQTDLQLREELRRLGVTFAERFGTFSSQGDFSNITDLYSVMSQSLRAWAQNYLADLQKQLSGDKYQGTTTRVISSRFISFDAAGGRAELLLTTQRQKSDNSPANSQIVYQDLTLGFIKDGELWKVDSAFWEKK